MLSVGGRGAPLSFQLACLVLAITLVVLGRRYLLVRNAYRPGPVDVKDLVAATPGDRAAPPLGALTALFRQQLSETQLYPPCVLPAEAPADSFLDLLGDVDLEPKKLGTSLLRLLSRLRPKVAYLVTGVLRCGDHDPACGVTVTVTSYAIRGSRMETVWDQTWEGAVRRAGYWVAAALLPVTRAGRRPPWQQWYGRDLPYQLFAHYQRARELGNERRFDEALDRYYAALHRDPTNLYLRSQIAATQEKLGLSLAALEMYRSVFTLGGQSTQEGNRRLWSRPLSWARWKSVHHRQRYGVVMQARHRYAVVLGMSERMAASWSRAVDRSNPSDRALDELRQSLRPVLADRYWQTVAPPCGETDPDRMRDRLRRILRDPGQQEHLRVVFQRACAQEMCRLAEDCLISRLVPRMSWEETLNPAVLRINRDVWAPLRLAWAWYEFAANGTPDCPDSSKLPPPTCLRWRRAVYWRATEMRWPAKAQDLEERLRHARRSRCPVPQRRRIEWQEHYNSACVYAVAMHGYTELEPERQTLADRATLELEKAVRCAESGFVELKRSWLLTEDPDLSELRREACFRRFERETYPHPFADRYRPESGSALDAEVADYDRQLLDGVAHVMERTWHERADRRPVPDIHTVADWFEREESLWKCLLCVVAGGGEHWPDRMKLLRTLKRSTPELAEELCARVPELDELLERDLGSPGPARPHDIVNATDRIRASVALLREQADPARRPCRAPRAPGTVSHQWLVWARQADAVDTRPLRRVDLHRLCTRNAAVWQAVRTLLDPADPDGRDAFNEALERLKPPPGTRPTVRLRRQVH
ncbi:hypothetical protein [Kitasatospora sp. NPDC058190]|uniref:hypothetical protein n=1 Tax=Kitasatospora sp. NPDC058190 TaxID=3346371 RepID=UPI0036DF28C2